jgi:hypothetical protein
LEKDAVSGKGNGSGGGNGTKEKVVTNIQEKDIPMERKCVTMVMLECWFFQMVAIIKLGTNTNRIKKPAPLMLMKMWTVSLLLSGKKTFEGKVMVLNVVVLNVTCM